MTFMTRNGLRNEITKVTEHPADWGQVENFMSRPTLFTGQQAEWVPCRSVRDSQDITLPLAGVELSFTD